MGLVAGWRRYVYMAAGGGMFEPHFLLGALTIQFPDVNFTTLPLGHPSYCCRIHKSGHAVWRRLSDYATIALAR